MDNRYYRIQDEISKIKQDIWQLTQKLELVAEEVKVRARLSENSDR